MPPLLPVPSCARVTVSGTLGSYPWANVLHLDYGKASLTADDATSIASQTLAAYHTRFGSSISNAVSITTCTVTDLSSEFGVVISNTAALAGTNVAQPMPMNVACCITWKVATHYKGGHPRTYLPGAYLGASTDGRTWASAYLPTVRTAAAGFLTDMNAITGIVGGSSSLVAVHRVKNKVQLTPPTTEAIQSAYVDSRVDSQRRRLGKDVP